MNKHRINYIINQIKKNNNVEIINKLLFECLLQNDIAWNLLFESKEQFSNAINDLNKWLKNDYVLIGGLAIGAHSIPRTTNDIDIIAKLTNRKILSSGSFGFSKPKSKEDNFYICKHIKSNIIIEIFTTKSKDIPNSENIIKSAVLLDVFPDTKARVASLEYLIYSKMQRLIDRDKVDINSLLVSNFELLNAKLLFRLLKKNGFKKLREFVSPEIMLKILNK